MPRSDDKADGRAQIATLITVLRTGAPPPQESGIQLPPLPHNHPFVHALGAPERAAAAQALVDIGAAAVPGLIAALDASTLTTRAALCALRAIADERAVPAILCQLQRRGSLVRSRAVEALVAIGAPAVPHLITVPPDARGMTSVVDALARIRSVEAIPFLAAQVTHPRRAVRAAAARALQALGQAGVVPLIGVLARHARGTLEAAYALGNSGDAQAVEPLVALLSHPRSDVRHAATIGLIRVGQAAASRVAAVLEQHGQGAAEAALILTCIQGDGIDAALRAALIQGTPAVRRTAAIGLGQPCAGSVPAELVAAAAAPQARVREAAVWALGQRGSTVAVDVVIAGSRDNDAAVRGAAARALGRLAPDANALVSLLADAAPSVCAAAARAVGVPSPASISALQHLLHDRPWHVRCAALDGLERLGWRPETLAERVTSALSERDGESLAAMGPSAIVWLIDALGAADERLRRAAIEGIVAIGTSAAPASINALAHPHPRVRAGVISALGEMGCTDVVPHLARALEDGDPCVRRQAARALNRLGDWRGDHEPPPTPNELSVEAAVDYEEILAASVDLNIEGLIMFLTRVLPREWAAVYTAMNPHAADLSVPQSGGFDYLFDSPSLLCATGSLDPRAAVADRVVAVHGRSRMLHAERDESRIRGAPLGAVELLYAARSRPYDKGHFMGHALGGALDINLFPQVSTTNRGTSDAGRRFRELERYALERPGTYCFARPLYGGFSDHPLQIEFGVLRWDGTLWIESFSNVVDDNEARAIERSYRERVLGRQVPW